MDSQFQSTQYDRMDFGSFMLPMDDAGLGYASDVQMPQSQGQNTLQDLATTPSFSKTDTSNIFTDFLDDEAISTDTETHTSFSFPSIPVSQNNFDVTASAQSNFQPTMDLFGSMDASFYDGSQDLDATDFLGSTLDQTASPRKRSFQGSFDFPQPKRQAIPERQGLSPFASTVPSLWTGGTPQTFDSDMGLDEDAADVCATWFSKRYASLPSDQDIEALSHLTKASSNAIRNWFGQMLKQGMAGHDSAYKSQSTLTNPVVSPKDQTTEPVTQQSTTEVVFEECSTSRKSTKRTTQCGKKTCSPTANRELLKRDENKIFQCTRGCGKRYGKKCDWRRNEEEGYPSKHWLCSLCISSGVDRVRPCYRRYHFTQHFNNIHQGLSAADYEADSLVHLEIAFPRRCGFCPQRFSSRNERIDHIANHFRKGKCMLDWNVNDDDDVLDDGGDDNDDNKPDDDTSGDDHPMGDNGPDKDIQRKPGSGQGGDNARGDNDDSDQDSFFTDFSQFYSLRSLKDTDKELVSECLANITRNEEACLEERTAYILNRLSVLPPGGDATRTDLFEYVTNHGERVSQEEKNASSADGCLPKSCSSSSVSTTSSVPSRPSPSLNPSLLESGTEKPEQATLSELDRLRNAITTFSKQTVSHDIRDELTQMMASSKQSFQWISARPGVPNRVEVSQYDHNQHHDRAESFLSVKLLGSGGFSTVDECVHQGTNLRLVRKTLKNRESTALHEVQKEIQILQKLRHPHVIRFLGAYSRGDKMSILLSPVAETNLSAWIDKCHAEKPQGIDHAVFGMFGCLVSSIRYLHEQRPLVKHMDIKPQNILVKEGKEGQLHVILTDFGVASVGDQTSSGLTRRYAAPEVAEKSMRLAAADIWSLGCVFLELSMVAHDHEGFRKEYRKLNYSDDLPRLKSWIRIFQDQAETSMETNVIRTIETMLHAEPCERPIAEGLSLVFKPAACCSTWEDEGVTFPSPKEEMEALSEILSKTHNASVLTEDNLFGGLDPEIGSLYSQRAMVSQTHGLLSQEQVDVRSKGLHVCIGDHKGSERCGNADLHRQFDLHGALYTNASRLDGRQEDTKQCSCLHGCAGIYTSLCNNCQLRYSTSIHGGIDLRSHTSLQVDNDLHGAKMSLQRAKLWLQECSAEHASCRRPENESALPAHLLDLGAGSDTSIGRLIATLGLVSSALSYVALGRKTVGGEIPRLTTANLQSLSHAIPNKGLPKALIDAIKVTKEVGCRYLWVDSLCVLHDDQEDRLQDLVNVYRNALLTIVPTPAHDGIDNNNGKVYERAQCTDSFGTHGLMDCQSDRLVEATLQFHPERLLSSRLLHLGEQMYWECNGLKASETFPHGLSPLIWESIHSRPHASTGTQSPAANAGSCSTTPFGNCLKHRRKDHMEESSDSHQRADATCDQIETTGSTKMWTPRNEFHLYANRSPQQRGGKGLFPPTISGKESEKAHVKEEVTSNGNTGVV